MNSIRQNPANIIVSDYSEANPYKLLIPNQNTLPSSNTNIGGLGVNLINKGGGAAGLSTRLVNSISLLGNIAPLTAQLLGG